MSDKDFISRISSSHEGVLASVDSKDTVCEHVSNNSPAQLLLAPYTQPHKPHIFLSVPAKDLDSLSCFLEPLSCFVESSLRNYHLQLQLFCSVHQTAWRPDVNSGMSAAHYCNVTEVGKESDDSKLNLHKETLRWNVAADGISQWIKTTDSLFFLIFDFANPVKSRV